MPISLAVGVLLSALVGAGAAEALPGPADTMPLSEVKPGMKGHGLTVFSGTTPERFDVEVISTLANFRPNQDLILIKTPNHPRLEAAKTVAGMSGSPIYLNNRMIGAYAYGWMFGSEAIAGVTPIKSMLEELARPIPRNLVPRGGSPLPTGAGAAGGASPVQGPRKGARMFRGATDGYALADHARQLADVNAPALAAPSGSSLMRASTPILLGGMTGVSMKMATDLLGPMGLEPVQAGGGRSSKPDPSAPAKFVDGGAIGVELVRGDVSAMGLGTVTRVSGDKMVAFGHPMLNGGIESLPTSVARVHWILATQNRSFKIGESVRSLGALVNDRQAAIVVDASVKAPTFPMKMTIEGVEGAPKPVWNMEVAHDQFMAPMFVAMGLGSAVETTTSERRDMTWRAISRLKVKGYGAMDFVDFGSGNGNPAGQDDFARGRMVRAMGMLLNNPWEDVTIESVETKMKVTFAREVAMLRGAKVMEPEIDAGQPVRIRLELQPYQGKIETRTLELMLPNELAGKEVEIEIQPGYQVEKPLPTPDSVAELVAVLPQQSFDPESLVLTYRLKDAGATYKNKLASRLPPSALDTLRPSSDSDAPETFGSVVQTAFPMKRFIVGRDTVRVEVRPVLR
ncbi:MAG: hypothetical protein WKG00_08870 [Polyangiaceae bacterium]